MVGGSAESTGSTPLVKVAMGTANESGEYQQLGNVVNITHGHHSPG